MPHKHDKRYVCPVCHGCGTVSGNFRKAWVEVLIGSGMLNAAVGKALGPADKLVVKGAFYKTPVIKMVTL